MFISCKNEKSFGTIYFFEQEDLHTILPLNCSEIFHFTGLRKVEMTDKYIYDLLISSKIDADFSKTIEPDTRYRIEIDSATFCFDYMGQFKLNNEGSGKIHFINKIQKFLSENKNKSKSVTEETPKPWNN